MRTAIVVALLVVGLTAVPALAGDGQVPQGRLKALGLSGARVMSDTQALRIRGMSSSAQVTGLSLSSSVVFDPETGSVDTKTNSFFTRNTSHNGGLHNSSKAAGIGGTGSFSNLSININNGDYKFNGTASGVGGFFGFGFAR